MFQGGPQDLGRLFVPSGAEEQFGEPEGSGDVGRIGLQGLPVTPFRLRGTPQHLQYQRAVGERSGARGARSAFEHLVKKGEGARQIAAHRKGGGGGGANAGGDSVAASFQNAVEESCRRRWIAGAQTRIGQPAGGAQRGAVEWLAGRGNQRCKHRGGGTGIAGQQMEPRLADVEGWIPRIPCRSGLHHARCFHPVTAVEQQPQQFHPVVPALAGRQTRSLVRPGSGDDPAVPGRSEQQVAAPRPQPAFLVPTQQTLALGGPVGIRVLGEQLAESKAGLRILR